MALGWGNSQSWCPLCSGGTRSPRTAPLQGTRAVHWGKAASSKILLNPVNDCSLPCPAGATEREHWAVNPTRETWPGGMTKMWVMAHMKKVKQLCWSRWCFWEGNTTCTGLPSLFLIRIWFNSRHGNSTWAPAIKWRRIKNAVLSVSARQVPGAQTGIAVGRALLSWGQCGTELWRTLETHWLCSGRCCLWKMPFSPGPQEQEKAEDQF